MILFLVIFFLIYFIAKVFIFSDYFNKLDGLDKIIFIFLFIFIIWGILTIYYLFSICYKIIYITNEIHPFDSGTPIESFLHYYLIFGLFYQYIIYIVFYMDFFL
jgi:hypothetical protein